MPALDVFISWSGPLSQDIATVFHELVPELLPGTKPWMSSEDIPKGKPWFSSILSQIGKSPICLMCITDQNLRSSWLYYEAGGIAFAMQDPYVCPYLVNVGTSDLSSTPLGQMQCTRYDREDTWRLLRDLNRRLETPNDEHSVRETFDAKWPAFKKKLDRLIENHWTSDEEAQKPRDTKELSDAAKHILLEASQDDHGVILMCRDSGGFTLQTNKKSLCEKKDLRAEASYRSAMKELLARGMIEGRGNRGETFGMLKPGYDMADVLRASEKAQEPADMPAYSDADLKNIIHEWFANQGFKGGTETIRFAKVDADMKIPAGSTKRLLGEIVGDHNYRIEERGEHTARIRHFIPESAAPVVSNPGWNDPRNPFRRR